MPSEKAATRQAGWCNASRGPRELETIRLRLKAAREEQRFGRDAPNPDITTFLRWEIRLPEFRHFLVHAAAVALLALLFGANVYSGSIDVAAHFQLIDFLAKNDVGRLATDPSMSAMANYPRGSHWLAAAVGFFTAAPYVAMWMICMAAIYLAYFAMSRIALASGGYVGLAAFLGGMLLLRFTAAVTGYEIFGNFFYSQLVGTSVYFLLLAYLSKAADPEAPEVVVAMLVASVVLMFFHALPTLNLMGAYSIFLLLRFSFLALDTKSIRHRRAIILIGFGIGALVIVVLHPSLRAMKVLSLNDGSLNFGVSPYLLFVAGVAVALGSLYRLFKLDPASRGNIDTLLVSALISSIVLLSAQLALFWLRGDGSIYAIKKHFFFLVPLTVLNGSRLIAAAIRPFHARKHEFATTAACGMATTFVLYFLAHPMSMRAVIKPLNFAQSAIESSFGDFKPGNTLVIAKGVDPVTRYMIDLAVFKMTSNEEALNVIYGTFDTTKKAYVMIDNSTQLRERCPVPQAQNSEYAIVPTRCLMRLPANGEISFGFNQASDLYLKSGWWPQEDWGVWSNGKIGAMQFDLPDEIRGKKLLLKLDLRSLPSRIGSNDATRVLVDGVRFAFEINGDKSVEIEIPESLSEDGKLLVELVNERPLSPKAAGINEDGRVLGLGLKSIRIRTI
ncbi:hypothetical protein [Variovorax sp. GT1P44]|uniref:hypothetical protein n=1 Tax=Variovorax sp. GT1P44 TaxID=3443742 RepID=UPI003F48D071